MTISQIIAKLESIQAVQKLWRKRPRLRLLTAAESAVIDSMRAMGKQTFIYSGPCQMISGEWIYQWPDEINPTS